MEQKSKLAVTTLRLVLLVAVLLGVDSTVLDVLATTLKFARLASVISDAIHRIRSVLVGKVVRGK